MNSVLVKIKSGVFQFRIRFQKRMRALYVKRKYRIKNGEDISVLSSNCLGAVVLHDFGLRFNTPTVNLWMNPTDFIKFVGNLEFYLSQNVEELIPSPKSYPCGRLGDITLYFQHYQSFREAEQKWEERKKRINRARLFVIMVERDGCTYEDLENFDRLPCKKVVFTRKKYPGIQSAYYIKGFEKQDCVTNILAYQAKWLPFKYYDQFHFENWFEEG